MKQLLANKKILLLLGLVAGFVIWQTILAVSRAGMITVTIDVLPRDSTVTANGKQVSNKTAYLVVGTYTFTASKPGFSSDQATVTISKNSHYVGLTPGPVSAEAKAWQKEGNNASEQEGISSRMAEATAATAQAAEPLLALLPYQDPTGPFSIDVGVTPTSDGGTNIFINNSTPAGRTRAIQWIIDHGFNPADYHITFNDTAYPLASEGE